MPGIETSTAWKTLAAHADRMKRIHLRDLLTDAARNSALTVNANGILFDYSRQNVNIEVRDKGRVHTVEYGGVYLSRKKSTQKAGIERVNLLYLYRRLRLLPGWPA